MERLWIRTGARLHFGQFDLNGSLGRLYGGSGLSLESPCLELVVQKSDSLVVESQEEEARIEKIASAYLDYFALKGVKITVNEVLPSHMGFGSGTQLALATGFAISKLYGMSPSSTEISMVTDREGSRSGLGVAAFFQGGFLVDGGKKIDKDGVPGKNVPPIISRSTFPESWSVIVSTPLVNKKMFGSREAKAFKSMPPMKEEVSGQICRLVLMKLLPGIAEEDLESFGSGLSEIQALVGDYFANVQGGRFASAESKKLADCFGSLGLVGIGQSSWGPTVYGFCKKERGNEILSKLKEQTSKDISLKDVDFWLTSGSNNGVQWGFADE